ncbi:MULTISPECIES: hypothetical protein [unclassified Actinomadura]|uniref:hypothetical protein n=1 Tax=unclassified Actinomadura TaxID=2626254 RepID=UPI0011EF68C9|nr:hypothetical protein [Actinomadura sp. K4S16]
MQAQQASKSRAAAEYVEFPDLEPSARSDAGTRTWTARGQNFVVAYSSAVAGDELTREDQSDEYVVVLPHEGCAATVRTPGDERSVTGQAVIVMPPGRSSVVADADCDLVRLFTVASAESLARTAVNQDSYEQPDPKVASFEPWPDPPGGHRIRAYPLSEVPVDPERFGRIFRCSTFMVNFLNPRTGVRDPESLSPHQHDDFEQCSLAVEGDFVHHIRTPWTRRMSEWLPDEHQACGSPSVAVIPPTAVHTTQSVGSGRNQLIDIFCPPRADFSARPGLVLNSDDYPTPA